MTLCLTETYLSYKRKGRGGCGVSYLPPCVNTYIYIPPQTHDLNYVTCNTESNGMLYRTDPYLLFCHFSPVDNIKIIPIHYIFIVAGYALACVLSM